MSIYIYVFTQQINISSDQNLASIPVENASFFPLTLQMRILKQC
jgi:hypothetical protein